MGKRKFFGTDGVRGLTNTPPMTAEVALKLGMAAGAQFIANFDNPKVVIGKDTRLSGYMLEPALTSGFISVGMHVFLVGPMPTPAVAMLTRSMRANLGVMISASHNPYYDNGIKLFGPDGNKLSDDIELAIERLMVEGIDGFLAAPERLGRAKRLDDAPGRYIEFVKNTFPRGHKLTGMKIVIDCANGAAYHLGKTILWELGADVIETGVEPTGFNINEHCGSTHPARLCKMVVEHKAHLGIALDGDADRVVLCDEKGHIIDGDQVMALIASHWLAMGRLNAKTIVATVMSNLGLERYLDSLGVHLERVQVGDRYVAEKMREGGFNVGGEQSGHIILSDYNSTGDGLVAALQVLAVIAESQKPASQVCRLFQSAPQLLKNVRYFDKDPLQDARVQEAIAIAEKKLLGKGRLLIRKSGTEPLIRIMAEGEPRELIEDIVKDLVHVVEEQRITS